MPANVFVSVAGQVLTLTAVDLSSAEGVRIIQDPEGSAGQFRLERPSSDTTTTFNSFTFFDTKLLTPFIREIRIDLKGDVDEVEVVGVQLLGNLTINTGSGNSTIDIEDSTHIGGSLSIVCGPNTETIGIDNHVSVLGSVTVSLGDGVNNLNLEDDVAIAGNLTITGGASTDFIAVADLLVGGSASVNLGNGTNTFGSASTPLPGRDLVTRIVGGLNYFGGEGNDTFGVGSPSAPEPSGLNIEGLLKVNVSHGDNIITLYRLHANQAAAFAMSSGSGGISTFVIADCYFANNLSFKAAPGFFSGSVRVLIDDTDDNDEAAINIASAIGTSIVGTLSYFGCIGDDELKIGRERPVRIGAMSVKSFDNPDGDSVILANTQIAGVTTLNGSTAEIHACHFGGNLSILTVGFGSILIDDDDEPDTGDTLPGSVMRGKLQITMSQITDNLEMGDEARVTVYGKTIIKTGGGVDTVSINDVVFLNSVTLDTGDGNDAIFLDTEDTEEDGGLFFNSTFSLKAGAGADALTIGETSLNSRRALFAVKPALDGGSGAAAEVDVITDKNHVLQGVAQAALTLLNWEQID